MFIVLRRNFADFPPLLPSMQAVPMLPEAT
jgi:hypothetical protein